MLIDDIETIAIMAGADEFIYDDQTKQNILADGIVPGNIICMMDEVQTYRQRVVSNGVEDAPTIRIAFTQQVEITDYADNNKDIMDTLLAICKQFLVELTKSGKFQKGISSNTVKYTENMTDANLIGWQMTIVLTPNEGYSSC